MTTETEEVKDPIQTPVSNETKKKLNGLSAFFEENDENDQENLRLEKERTKKMNSALVSEKIAILYAECLQSAKEKDIELSIEGDNNNDINTTYVEEAYEPGKSTLDEANLYLNLIVLKMLQSFGIVNYEFDTDVSKVDKSEFNMNDKFWKEKLLQDDGFTVNEKYVRCLETSFRQSFYTAFFNTVAQNADQVSYNEHKLKMKNALSFLDEEDSENPETFEPQTIHNYFVDWLKKQTKSGSVVFITPDLTKFVHIDEPSTEDVVEEDKQQITYLGKSDDRMFYEINTKYFGKMMKGFKQGAFFLNGGDYIINPEKPLVFFNKVENPYIEDPILLLFNNMDFKFGKDNTVFARINDLED